MHNINIPTVTPGTAENFVIVEWSYVPQNLGIAKTSFQGKGLHTHTHTWLWLLFE